MWAQALWQRASGVRGHLALHGRRRPTDLGLDPDQGWPGEGDDGGGYVLVLGGHVTGAVLDWYGHPSGPVLERVRAVQASAVESLDEAGRALLIRVYLVTRPRRVLLPSPSPAVVAALARYGGLGLFDVHPRGDENRGG